MASSGNCPTWRSKFAKTSSLTNRGSASGRLCLYDCFRRPISGSKERLKLCDIEAISSVLHIPPAVDLQHHAGDELGFVAGEVEAGVGDVAWPRHAAERDGGDEFRAV